jgi:hypothetical protein
MATRSLARDPYPDPEGRGDDLEHVSEITVRAVLPATKLRPCAACGGRFRGRDLFEVPEDHLTFFEGQELCRECALGHGLV